MGRDAYVSFEQNYTDLATAESFLERLRNENRATKQQLDDMQGSITRLQRASLKVKTRCWLQPTKLAVQQPKWFRRHGST
eukprot:s164_g25.t1